MKKITILLSAIFIFATIALNAQNFTIVIPADDNTDLAEKCPGEDSGTLQIMTSTTSGTTSISITATTGSNKVTIIGPNHTTGDGTTTDVWNFKILYDIPGSFVVTAELTNGAQTETKTWTGNIKKTPELVLTNTSSSNTICPGETVTLSATIVNGTAVDNYNWYKDGSFFTQTTASTLDVDPADAGAFRVAGENECDEGAKSGTIVLTEGTDTDITSEPQDVDLNGGSSATLSVTAVGSNLSYQWYYDGSAIDGSNADFTGYNTNTLSINNAFLYTDTPFSCYVDGDCGSAELSMNAYLPVKLVEFKGRMTQNNVALNWSTEQEINNDFFAIERSFDGENFTEIGKVNGALESHEILNYSWIDRDINSRSNSTLAYYRLKQTDLDGTFNYSDVIEVNISKGNIGINNIYGNGTSEEIKVSISLLQDEEISISIHSINGQLISSSTKRFNKGENIISLDLESNDAGVYILSIIGKDNSFTEKIVKK